MSSARRRTWFVALITVAAALLPTIVATAPAAAASQIEVTVGYGGYTLRGRSFPVAVELTTDRLVQGRIEVSADSQFDGQDVTAALPVEVPGGGAKRYVVTLPSGPWFEGAPVNVRARLIAGDGSVVATSAEQTLRAADDRELVGVLPGAGAPDPLPASLPLAIDAGVASFFPIGTAELAQAPAALDPLGTIAAGADELGQLDDETRRGVLAWLERGGTLLVGAAPGSPVPGLPEAWQPDPSGSAHAGLGRVQLVGDRLRTGAWAGLVYPTPAPVAVDPQFGPFGMPQSVGGALGVDAGLRVPRLGWLLAFLVVYAGIVGPITAIVLGRAGRAELAWVVIPAVALVFTAGTWGIAKGLRSSTGLAHAEIIELSPAGARSTAFLGVAARGRTDIRVSAGPGTWSAHQHSSGDGAVRSRIAIGASGPEATLRLSAGQFAVAQLTGPSNVDGGLEVTASSERDGEAAGAVRNTGSVALEEVVVFIGNAGTTIGRLEPGEEQDWSMRAAAGGGAQRFPFDLVDGRLWSRASGTDGPTDPESIVNYPAWITASPWAGPNRPAGIAVAAGWTREGAPALTIDGDQRPTSGRRALVTTSPVEAPGRLTDMAIRGEPIRASMNGFGGQGGSLASIVRFTLPQGARPTGALQARIPMAGRVELWDGRAWVIPETGPAVFGGGDIALGATVPPSAVLGGQVFLRVDNMQGPTVVGNLTMVALG